MKTKLAIIYIRQNDLYPWQSIQAGLESLGYQVKFGLHKPKDDDLLITWTPWKGTASHRQGELHKANGGKWIVFENGYIPDIHGVKYWAAGLNGYNGWGDHRVKDDSSRWDSWGLEIKQWRRDSGEYSLVVGQFGHKDTRYSMPKDWPEKIIKKINPNMFDQNIIYRPKPSRPRAPDIKGFKLSTNKLLLDDLKISADCFTWNSPSVSVECLLFGVPVFINSKTHIIIDLGYNQFEYPSCDRKKIFNKLAWTQWKNKEIEEGKPFVHLLS